MRLLECSDTGEFSFTKPFASHDIIPPYAILSHTWLKDAQEPTFKNIMNSTGGKKLGYKKLQFCQEQSSRDGLQYFWVDTCCINKANKAELSQAINSMFRWYQKAVKCYVYLSDVSISKRKANNGDSRYTWEPAFRVSKWFTRGWTLQELLAPSAVEFFSKEGNLLGDKISLVQQIHEITGVPKSAIQGARLFQFTVEDRLSWMRYRQTKVEEDRAYSLLGLFDIYIAPIPGEGACGAFKRLLDEIHKRDRCVQDVRLTDPRDDKKRIVGTKGGLIEGSYSWVLDHSNFKQWHSDPQSRLLWIKGDPGKGKTMLLCGITDELEKSTSSNLSFFFCQGTDSNINNATAVLRGLLYLLCEQQPLLASHLRMKYDQAGRSLFEDANAWIAVSDAFTSVVLDPDLKETYLVVDALDECIADLSKLLDLIIRTSSLSNRIKWLLSSRNELHIEQKLESISAEARLSLELKYNADQVARAVDLYIDEKLSCIGSLEIAALRSQVREVLRQKANGTFLWVALVVQELENPESWDPLEVVKDAPTGLHKLYGRMVNQILRLTERNSEICRFLLAAVTVAYRPLYLAELGSLCKIPGQVSTLMKNTRKLVAMCGSFLTVRENQVYLIHQSAKDYLSHEEQVAVFHHQGKVHYDIFSRSLELMSGTLKRDVYSLGVLGYPIDKVTVPADDPLATARYSCVHWIDHLYDSIISKNIECQKSLQDGAAVHTFIKARYLYWLEALSLCKCMPAGVTSMAKLETLLQRTDATTLTQLVHDAHRFIMYHKRGIETAPLQAYASALLFSPTGSLIRRLFQHEEPTHIKIMPPIRDSWSTCLSTLEGHSSSVTSVAFSHDSTRLASASDDRTVKIWDLSSGACLFTLEGHSGSVTSVAFSHNSARLASASDDMTVKIWDLSSGACLFTLEGHSSSVTSVAFSHDSARLASASIDRTVKIWDLSSGACMSTLEGHSSSVTSIAFSHDSARLASASIDRTAKIWDLSSGACLSTLEGHNSSVSSVAFSHDSARLASASYDRTVKIWELSSGACLSTLEGHSSLVTSVAFSHDSARLASASDDMTVKIWDLSSGACLSTLEGHSGSVTLVAFSHDSARLASASDDMIVKIWDLSSDACFQTFGVGRRLNRIAFDDTGLYLHSEIGTIDIYAFSGLLSLPTISESRSPQYQDLALSTDGVWIIHDSEHQVWLPSEYRPSCSTVSRSTIGIGVGTGTVWTYRVELNTS